MDKIYIGDCREGMRQIPENSVQTCVTSPPYFGLRDYGHAGQIGLEQTPNEYVQQLVEVFREVWRVLQDDGTLWLNLGDSYVSSATGSQGNNSSNLQGRKTTQCKAGERPDKTGFGLPAKNLIGIPWRVAFALQADGWILRQDIIWHKPNPMPESVTDRCTKSHEYIFLFSKQQKYYYDNEAIKEAALPDAVIRDREPTKLNNTPGRKRMNGLTVNDYETRNKRSVWTVATKPYTEAHFATFPDELITPCILAGCPEGGIVFDPFMGSGTVAATALRLGRDYRGCELNPEYLKFINARVNSAGKLFEQH